MKYVKEITAAMAGTPIQRRNLNLTQSARWHIPSVKLNQLISQMALEYTGWEYRIAVEPVPDQVYYDYIRPTYKTKAAALRAFDSISEDNYIKAIVKLTIKTDENGVETQHVEIEK